MPRTDREYWARLRVDKASNWTAGLATIAVVACAFGLIELGLDAPQSVNRGNPLYWAILLPIGWWGGGLSGFEPRQVRLMAPLTFVAPALALLWLGIVLVRRIDPTAWIILALVSLGAAIASRIVYRYSLLKREGPAR